MLVLHYFTIVLDDINPFGNVKLPAHLILNIPTHISQQDYTKPQQVEQKYCFGSVWDTLGLKPYSTTQFKTMLGLNTRIVKFSDAKVK